MTIIDMLVANYDFELRPYGAFWGCRPFANGTIVRIQLVDNQCQVSIHEFHDNSEQAYDHTDTYTVYPAEAWWFLPKRVFRL